MSNTSVSFDYFVKTLLPVIVIAAGGLLWGARLESKAEFLEQRVVDLESEADAMEEFMNTLKIDLTAQNGKIETLTTMVNSLTKMTERIEKKLDQR